MKRSPLKRRKPLKRGGRIKAHGPRNKKSGGHLFPAGVDEDYREWVRARSCVVRGHSSEKYHAEHVCQGAIQVCHVKSRGSGGVDAGNVVSMCWRAHFQQGLLGIRAFQQHWGVNLAVEAVQLWGRYKAEQIGDTFMRANE